MIRGQSQANRGRNTVKTLQELEQKVQEIKGRYEDNNENMPPYEKSYLERLEQPVLYKIKSGQTKPQALVLMCMSLIFVLLALNVVMFSVVPDYTTYGSQYYRVNNTIGNVTTEIMQRCNNIHAPADGCIMTRVAFLLMAYHTNIWFFGAIYYWMVWIFVVVIVAGT
ncbi:hypothetical protein TCAL_16605 [Tigriopus californicus]|uniref:Uncharacterized protein n=1 Tax=Tigriopus californicus TaxID=6832 RepID=A0A553NDC0_TIGCA|nr:hypothetical protein TCAL_16605 [Tigriopus californicus]